MSSLPICTQHGHQHRLTVTRGCIDTICLSWWWARCARNMWRVKNKNKYIDWNLCVTFAIYQECFGQFLSPSSGVYSLYAQQWYMLYSFRTGPGWNCSSILVLLDSCLKTCMTYTIAERTVNKILMMGRGIARNTWGSWQNKLEKLVHLVGLL